MTNGTEITSLKFFSDGTGQHFKQKFSICQVVTLNFPRYARLHGTSLPQAMERDRLMV